MGNYGYEDFDRGELEKIFKFSWDYVCHNVCAVDRLSCLSCK